MARLDLIQLLERSCDRNQSGVTLRSRLSADGPVAEVAPWVLCYAVLRRARPALDHDTAKGTKVGVKMIPPYKRAPLALGLAGMLALPTFFKETWEGGAFLSIALTMANLPGILFPIMGRFFPPEGFPGQSLSHAALMILVQSASWYAALSFLAARHRHRSKTGPN